MNVAKVNDIAIKAIKLPKQIMGIVSDVLVNPYTFSGEK